MTQEKHTAVWNNCLKTIGNILEPQQFNTWFKPLKAVALQENTLTLEVPSEFFREYLEQYYIDVLVKTLRRELGPNAGLKYRVPVVMNQPPLVYDAAHGSDPVNRSISVPTYSAADKPGPLVYPGIARLNVNPYLNSVYCFENLVEGDCNRMAVSAGKSIAAAPGKTPFNPIFIFGGPGLGKTHIAQAIGLAVKQHHPEQVVLYVPAIRFKTQFMNAAGIQNKLTDFMAFYSKMDVLIVDDIQELSSPGAQNAFFHIFNHLHQSGKQLVFTSDRSPVELQNFEERLLSRFKWGLNVQLLTPDYNTRLAMLRARSRREGVEISEDVLEYLAATVKNNFRELEGTMISLIANATLARREITIDLAREVTGKIIGEQKVSITIDMVEKVVCDYFNITIDALMSKSRKRQIVQARQIAMYTCRNLIDNCSLATIGAEIGGKDHATVLHACNTVQDLMATDKAFRRYVSDIEKSLTTAR